MDDVERVAGDGPEGAALPLSAASLSLPGSLVDWALSPQMSHRVYSLSSPKPGLARCVLSKLVSPHTISAIING